MTRAAARLILVALLGATCLGARTAVATTAPDASSIESYRDRVHQARLTVEQALPTLTDRSVAGRTVMTLVKLLPTAERVRVGDTVVTVDHGLLRALILKLDVTHDAPTRRELGERIRTHLVSLEAALPTGLGEAPSDPAALRRLVAAQRPRAEDSSSSRLIQQLNELLAKLIAWFARSALAPGNGPVALGAWIAVLVLVLLLVAWGLVRLLVTWRRSVSARDAVREPASDLPVVAAEADLPPDALAYAEGLARDGRFRDAVRALFGGAARRLADAGLLTRTRTRTNAELLAEVDGSSVRAPLGRLSDEFEVAWYGHIEPDMQRFRGAKEHYGQVVRAADGAEGAGQPVSGEPGGEPS